MICICSIYHSPRKEGMYLYVRKEEHLTRVPEELLALFGTPRHAFDFLLTPEKRLAREQAAHVLEQLALQGYYLQMPLAEEWTLP